MIHDTILDHAEQHRGEPFEINLSAGEHVRGDVVLDANLPFSRLKITAARNAVLSGSALTMLTVRAGAPPVELQGLELHGQVRIEGNTEFADCHFGSASVRQGRRLQAGMEVRALVISNGHVSISDTDFEDLMGGAIEVSGGSLAVHTSVFKDNQAERGGALLITGGRVVVDNSNFIDNHATDVDGGAIYVDGTNASLELASKTMITGSKGRGGSVVSDVPWTYRLPAPLAHYVSNPERDGVAQNVTGTYDYVCHRSSNPRLADSSGRTSHV